VGGSQERKRLFLVVLLFISSTGFAKDRYESAVPLLGDTIDRITFPNPYAHIPAQCYIETSGGTQNACQYCHTDGPYKAGLGNNTPQGGANDFLGNLQAEYAFVALHYPHIPNGSINPWQNTLFPEKLKAAVDKLGEKPESWDMDGYIREDNWGTAFAQRPGSPKQWDGGVQHPFRLFPALDPSDLPADTDGFVRSKKQVNGHFEDRKGWVTGWRSINFVPYGIFTPHTGSVSGIYIRLPSPFMKNGDGQYDLKVYIENLDLVARAVQDRLRSQDSKHYLGAASAVPVERGLYPVGTEFAHPLHYVDLAADGRSNAPSPFPGSRARRVKEIRWMIKMEAFEPNYGGPKVKEEDAPVYAGQTQGWIDNGAGWLLAGFIEDRHGKLRPQTPSELTQCVGCHSGNGPQEDIAYDNFTSGTGNTIDSTWALPRQFTGELGWREMDYMGYVRSPVTVDDVPAGRSTRGDPINRGEGKGEFRHFLDSVVGVSLYGVMPVSVEQFLRDKITEQRGYSENWPELNSESAERFLASQRLRQTLLRELTKREEHLDGNGNIAGALLYPSATEASLAARRYRQVVVTQRYDFGKDVFAQTPITFRYFRTEKNAFTHQDGKPYKDGEIIVDRPLDSDSANITYGIGSVPTLIDETIPYEQGGTANRDYLPLLSFPQSD